MRPSRTENRRVWHARRGDGIENGVEGCRRVVSALGEDNVTREEHEMRPLRLDDGAHKGERLALIAWPLAQQHVEACRIDAVRVLNVGELHDAKAAARVEPQRCSAPPW